MDKVEIVFAKPDQQLIIDVTVESHTVEQVIVMSGILDQFPEIDLATINVGIFGKLCKLEKIVESGDRIEIYRSLTQSPMDARRNRAVKSK